MRLVSQKLIFFIDFVMNLLASTPAFYKIKRKQINLNFVIFEVFMYTQDIFWIIACLKVFRQTNKRDYLTI